MKKKFGKGLVFALAAASFIIAVLEGLIYYGVYGGTPLFELILVVQNGIKAFLFTPDIPAQEVLASLQGDVGTWQYVVGCAYVAAVFIAPLCTATAVVSTVELLLRRGAHISGGKAPVTLVYGWSSTAQSILRKHTREAGDVYLIADKTLTNAQQLELTRHNVFPCSAKQEARLWKRAGRIFLLDESPAKNFSRYAALQRRWEESPAALSPKVICACEDAGVGDLITAFHDERVRRSPAAGVLPVSLFAMAELQAKAVWEACPISTYNFGPDFQGPEERRYDVSMALVGLGTFGQRLLEQAVSLGVLSSTGHTRFDVIDRDAGELLSFFKSAFSPAYVQVDREAGTLTVPAGNADGSLTIRFHPCDVDDGDFLPLLRRLNGEHPFTYAAVCLRDTDAALRCLNRLDRVLRESGRAVPVALRMEADPELAAYFKGETPFFGRVFPVCGEADRLTLERLAAEDAYAGAVRFNHIYNRFAAALDGGGEPEGTAESQWRALESFKQRSSLFQYLHQTVKAQRLAYERGREEPFTPEKPAEAGEYEALGRPPLTDPLALEFARMEHRRWCYYMAVNGWAYGEKRDNARRLNPCMVTWEALLRGDQRYTCQYDTTPYRVLTRKNGEE